MLFIGKKMTKTPLVWQAIFDDVNILKTRPPFPTYLNEFSEFAEDFACGVDFLLAYKDLVSTFITYRREIERLFHSPFNHKKLNAY